MVFYAVLPDRGEGGSIGGDGSESASSTSAYALTDTSVLQIWLGNGIVTLTRIMRTKTDP